MRRKGMISEEIIQSILITNTLNGGVSDPYIRYANFPEYREIAVRVPGVSPENLHVNINNNQLIVYFNRHIEANGALLVPQIVYNKPIPYFIDSKKIKALFNEGWLLVQLPYNEMANGYHRDIPIEK
jgi:HSP20 family molecular chaperone IbpA